MPKLVHLPATHNVMARWPLIAEAIATGRKAQDLADELGLSVDTIYKNQQNPAFKQYMNEAINNTMVPLFIEHADKLKQLWESKDPADRRLAVQEIGRMYRNSTPKETYNRNENLNLTVTQDNRTEIRQLLEEASPDEQQVIIKVFNRVLEKTPPKSLETLS